MDHNAPATDGSRALGATRLRIQPLCFGGNVFGWTIDEARSFELLDRFVGGGFNFIDTADVYSRWVPGHVGGESETIIGRWLKARGGRQRVVLATKVGIDMGPEGKGLSATHIRASIDRSLQRLQTDHVDLYYAHRDDETVPLEETLTAFADLVAAGKVRAIAASNYSAARLREALAISRRLSLPYFQVLQPEYNLVNRSGFEAELQPLCVDQGIAVLPYYALASGFLTGKYRSADDLGKSVRGGRVKDYLNERGLRILAALDAVAGRHRSTPAAVAIAWLAARPAVAAPIASATSAEQLDTLIAGVRLKLAPEDHAELTAASA